MKLGSAAILALALAAVGCEQKRDPFKPNTAPDAVMDLRLAVRCTSAGDRVDVSWTAPADDYGTPVAYDLRYSTQAIQESNWASATLVGGLPHPVPGTVQDVTVVPPSTGRFYFALKSKDDLDQWSEISNVPSASADPRLPYVWIRHNATALGSGSITVKVLGDSYEIDAGATRKIDHCPASSSATVWECIANGSSYDCHWDLSTVTIERGGHYRVISQSPNYNLTIILE